MADTTPSLAAFRELRRTNGSMRVQSSPTRAPSAMSSSPRRRASSWISRDFVWRNELPVGSSSQYAQYCAFREAKVRGVTVLLDGQGADELLGGYEQFFRDYVASLEERGEHERLERELPRTRQRCPLALPSALRKFRDRAPFRVRHCFSNHLRLGPTFEGSHLHAPEALRPLRITHTFP